MERLEYLRKEVRDIQKGREQDNFIELFYPSMCVCVRERETETERETNVRICLATCYLFSPISLRFPLSSSIFFTCFYAVQCRIQLQQAKPRSN